MFQSYQIKVLLYVTLALAGLPFGSALGTLNHVLAAEVLWYARMTSTPSVGKWQLSALVPYWSAAPSGRWMRTHVARAAGCLRVCTLSLIHSRTLSFIDFIRSVAALDTFAWRLPRRNASST